MTPVSVIRGNSAIVLAQPHSGIHVPNDIQSNLNEAGRALLDTDWHIPALYDGLVSDATIVRANFSRYVIDANRAPDGGSLYPSQNTTELVPETTFDGHPIWKSPPQDAEIANRLRQFHQPYHHALRSELDRAKRQHGFAVLYDCHSIRSEIPHLFEGRLPDLNIGTNDGTSCGAEIEQTVTSICEKHSTYTHVLNGRFKGGWTTRHYGQPQDGVHAIQMELSQANYLQTERPPFAYDPEGAARLREVLRDILLGIQETIETNFKTETIGGKTS